MSARAIRKLRADREAALASAAAQAEDEDDDDDDDDDDDVDVVHPSARAKKPAFAMMNDSDSDSGSSDSDNDNIDDNDHNDKKDSDFEKNNREVVAASKTAAAEEKEEEEEEEENLDSILEEFKNQDVHATTPDILDEEGNNTFNCCCIKELQLSAIDIKDLDVDYVMRTSLLNANANADETIESSANNNKNKEKRRKNRQVFLFGNPQNIGNNNPNNVKPPHYVGGGIGMTTYYIMNQESNTSTKKRSIPWPYSVLNEQEQQSDSNDNTTNNNAINSTMISIFQDPKRWFTFIYSDSYEKDYRDFKRIQESGDGNALVLFVAHHPYVVEALVSLGMMLYHANQSQEGLTFLRRSLWVYECATLSSFSTGIIDGQSFFIDYNQPENNTYYDALFRLARVNNMSGLARSSFSIGRYLLSLDPLRDPMGILLVLDHYALASNADKNDQWLVDFVEHQNIRIYYRDESTEKEYQCNLDDLPNWAYSYALALYRLNNSRPNSKSNDAIKRAISRFPSILDLLLNENDVDITSRSCRMDWQAVIDYTGSRANAIHGCSATNEMDPLVRMATEKAYDLISRIFVKTNHKLWSSDGIMLWLHTNLEELKSSAEKNSAIQPLKSALMRYSRVDPGDYEMKFQLLPAEANPLDPGLVHHALVIDPNRRRFLRAQRGGQRGDGNDEDDLFMFGQGGGVVRRTLLGPPTNNIDLDWPILEIFWRSLLPWNRIEEVPRPRP